MGVGDNGQDGMTSEGTKGQRHKRMDFVILKRVRFLGRESFCSALHSLHELRRDPTEHRDLPALPVRAKKCPPERVSSPIILLVDGVRESPKSGCLVDSAPKWSASNASGWFVHSIAETVQNVPRRITGGGRLLLRFLPCGCKRALAGDSPKHSHRLRMTGSNLQMVDNAARICSRSPGLRNWPSVPSGFCQSPANVDLSRQRSTFHMD